VRVGRGVTWLSLALACAPGCGGLRSVEGSLGELVEMGYQTVEVAQSPNVLAVNFVRPQGTGRDTVLQVSARLEGVTLQPGVSVDLSEVVAAAPRGTVARNVFNDPRTRFPDVARGSLTLEALPVRGVRVRGAFSVTFANGTSFANGRTAFATFEATVP